MNTTYTINENKTYNSREITFEGKPSEAVRTALKGLKLRWHGQKKCWYGFATEAEIIAAICAAEEDAPAEDGAAVYTDGYLGGGAVYGSKSGKHLYGADLSAAIRAYRYDESNSMVDYFDTNFYYDLEVKLPAARPAV